MRQLTVALTLIACALTASPAVGQVQDTLSEGTRVRLWLTGVPAAPGENGQRITGTLASYSGDSLTVHIHPDAGALTLAWPGLDRIDRSAGVPTRLESSIRGGLSTAAFGAVYFALRNEADSEFGSTGRAALVGAATGAVTGAVLGALLRTERWSRVRLER
jgi:hypothetical protein